MHIPSKKYVLQESSIENHGHVIYFSHNVIYIIKVIIVVEINISI